MKRFQFIIILITILFSNFCCKSISKKSTDIITGAERMDEYLDMLASKKVAFAGNHTSLVRSKTGYVHLVDSLLTIGVDIVKIFAPEHGFSGIASAGEKISDSFYKETEIPIISLFSGKKIQPSTEDMEGIDIFIFDIQDVGVRFYTYIPTFHYIMLSCAEHNIPIIILDRPNPNGDYFDGPILETKFTRLNGMHPIPVVHGLTLAEFLLMINGENWLGDNKKCELYVIPCKNYDHSKEYIPPVPPSPNLKSIQSIRLYPSIGLFQGTVVSEGRGTKNPFEIYGHPDLSYGEYYFTPKSMPEAMKPKFLEEICRGENLSNWFPEDGKWKIELRWLIKAYQDLQLGDSFFRGKEGSQFDIRTGNDQIRKDIQSGLSEEEIREKWQKELSAYKKIRDKYLIY